MPPPPRFLLESPPVRRLAGALFATLLTGCILLPRSDGAVVTIPEVFIDFESIRPNEGIRDQYLGQGVRFGPGVFGDPFPATSIQGNVEAANFNQTGLPSVQQAIVVELASLHHSYGFRAGGLETGNDRFQVEAFLASTLVHTGLFVSGTNPLPGGTVPSVFANGFVADGFDRLEITRTNGNNSFSIDDLELGVIPEPSALMLWWAALAVSLLRRRSEGTTAR